jgi:hypothetical protein
MRRRRMRSLRTYDGLFTQRALRPLVQGMCIINAADQQYRWSIDYKTVAQIWRAGCIISADHIADLLDTAFRSAPRAPSMHRICCMITILPRSSKLDFPARKSCTESHRSQRRHPEYQCYFRVSEVLWEFGSPNAILWSGVGLFREASV